MARYFLRLLQTYCIIFDSILETKSCEKVYVSSELKIICLYERDDLFLVPKPFLETAFYDVTNVEKVETTEELLRKVKETQDYSIVLHRLGNDNVRTIMFVFLFIFKKMSPCKINFQLSANLY